MSLFFKKHRSKTAMIAGIALFVILMFVNLQISTSPNKNGNINLIGLKLSLATPSAYAEPATCCTAATGYICSKSDKDYQDQKPCK